jgi:hypothetical protein
MSKIAMVVDGVITDYRDGDISEVPPHKQYLWRPVVEVYPDHDPNTQTHKGRVVTLEPDRVVWTYSVVSLPSPVPKTVTPRQLREALWRIGLLDDVEALIALMDRGTQIRWEYAVVFERNHPQWDQMGSMMDPPKTPEDIDAVFMLAGSID